MNIEAVGATIASPPRVNEPGQQVDSKRQANQQSAPSSSEEESKAQPEELLSQIKALTEDGVYSVRFEQETGSQELIVKIVNQETDEVIRQIPPEELLNLSKHLKELSGSIVNTMS
ncbi:flagellar protein FlaG [Desulfobulbus propionicus]|jgi:flagellar protein FlaG